MMTDAQWREASPADREAAVELLGLVDDPDAHGRHKPQKHTLRVRCGKRAYKVGFAPCDLVPIEIPAEWTDQ